MRVCLIRSLTFVQEDEIHRIDWEEILHVVFHNRTRRFLNEAAKHDDDLLRKRCNNDFTVSFGKYFGS